MAKKKSIWVWEQADGEDRLASYDIDNLKGHVSDLYGTEKIITFERYDCSLFFVKFDEEEIGFFKEIFVC